MREKFKTTIQTYNKIAKTYSKLTFCNTRKHYLNKFISMLPKKSKILDAGCGSGKDAQYFQECGFDVTAIDAAEKMIGEAKKKVKGVKFKIMDMIKTDFKDQTFEGIWAESSLVHDEKGNTPTVLGELKRILKDGGILYVCVKEGAGEELKKEEKYNNEPRFFSYYTLPEMEEILIDTGFEIISSGFSEDFMKRMDTKWIDIYCKKPIFSPVCKDKALIRQSLKKHQLH